MKQLDFLPRLQAVVEAVNLPSPIDKVEIGMLTESPSIALMPLAGGEEIVYYSGKRQKTLNVSVMMKHPSDAACFNTLTTIYRTLENLSRLDSNNDSFSFGKATTANLSHKVGVDEKNLNVWNSDFKFEILIEKGVIE